MNAKRILMAVLLLLLAGILLNQWRLQRAVARLSAAANANQTNDPSLEQADRATEKLRQAEGRYDDARTQLQIAEQKLATANAQLAQLDQRLRQLEGGAPRRPRLPSGLISPGEVPIEATPFNNAAKRSWGPEQAIGEPDTFQAGDIVTAWASREPDGGEEWLKLDYENSVDVAEVRVRETHNPGAISKVTALLANGTEITLWEGVEPKAEAPVEMSFQVPDSVNAKSVKVYLDTKRVAGWNEIDAVQLIGRDGSKQWAKQASASSTYAEPRTANQYRGLETFERTIEREVLR
jgi:hypothetical protein